MPRARIIRPGFWDSPDTAAASFRARLLYIAMWTWADDYGIGDATPSRLIAYAFPHDDIPTTEHAGLIAEVVEAYGVVTFEHDARAYYVIPTFSRHQPKERKAKLREELMEAATAAVSRANAAAAQGDTPERPSNVAELPRKPLGSADDNPGPAAVTS